MYALSSYGQTTGSFVVNGDFDKYYPVTFVDEGYLSNMATELEIGRSNVHTDAQWRGSLMHCLGFIHLTMVMLPILLMPSLISLI
ncbi:hypothetical protein D3C72_1894770 [compost metagenome]